MCTLRRLDIQWSPIDTTSLIYLPHRLLDSLQGNYHFSTASFLVWLALNRSGGNREVVEWPVQRLGEHNEFFVVTSAWLNEQFGSRLVAFWKSPKREYSNWWHDVLSAGQTYFAQYRWHWDFSDDSLWWINWWHVRPLHAFDHQSPPTRVLDCTVEDQAILTQSELCPTTIDKQVATRHSSRWF